METPPATTVTAEKKKAKTASERRISARHECDGFAEVAIASAGYLFRGEISDISEFGCFVKTRAHLNIGRSAQAELRFTVNGEHFSVGARVAAIRVGLGVGMEFSEIETTLHKNLLLLIEELSQREGLGY